MTAEHFKPIWLAKVKERLGERRFIMYLMGDDWENAFAEAYHKERVNAKAILDKETAIRLHRLINDLTSDNPEICPYEILAIKELENQVNNLLKQ